MRPMYRVRLFAACLLLWPVAAVAAEEPIAVIVAPGHAKGLKRVELTLVYKRKKLFWSDGSKVQPVNLPAANPYRRAFSQAVLGASPEELEKYWNDLYFHGISPPFVLSSRNAVVQFVAETPGAIGYVPYCSADSRVEVALVIGLTGRVGDDPGPVVCPKQGAEKQ